MRSTDASVRRRRRARANRGEGLGKNRHGRVDALEVTKREENAGLGKTKERYAWDEKWWEGHYANAAHKFAAAVGASGGGAGTSDSESSDSSDSEEDALMVKLGTVTGRDGVAYSGSKSDLKLMEELAKDNHRGSTFGGRVGKLERIAKFEAEQLAKYGIQSGSAVKAIETKTTPNERGAAKEKKKKKKDKKQEKKSTKSADDKDEPEPESEPAAAYEGEQSASTKERDWWFRAGFSWGGLVGSKREKDLTTDADGRPSKTRSGFTEDDQEALFKSAHERGVQKGTKRGLGGAGIIKSEWTGDRKTFAEDEDEDEDKASKKRAKKEKKDKKDKKKKKDKK